MLIPLIQGLVDANELTWMAAIKALSFNSANIADIKATRLAISKAANLTLIDPNHSWILDVDSQLSQGTNQALAYQTLKARVQLTLKDGQVTYAV